MSNINEQTDLSGEQRAFLAAEYISLREEIKDIKGRIFQIVGFGLLVLPAAETFVRNQKGFESVVLLVPVLVIVVALLYLSENQGLMRCAKYIRENIESRYRGVVGWESWMERHEEGKDYRQADKYISYCFYILFLFYYAGAVFLAAKYILASDAFGSGNQVNGYVFLSVALGLYVAIGVCFALFFFTHIESSTGTSRRRHGRHGRGAVRDQVEPHAAATIITPPSHTPPA